MIDAISDALHLAAPPAVLAISDYGAELPTGTGVTETFPAATPVVNFLLGRY